MSDVKVLLLPGSRRKDALSRRALQAVSEKVGDYGLVADTVLPEHLTAPLYDGDLEASDGVPDDIKALNQRMAEAGALIIVTPEYNGVFPALLKNTLDWMSRTTDDQPGAALFRGKPVLLLGTSPGANGGLRALPHLRAQMANLGMHVYGPQLAIGKAHEKLSEDGRATDDSTSDRMDTLVAGFAEFARKLS